ncbi:unnamed protein product [Cuscuta europaea]|uniref:Uncharacterized protein n=1 Tax=Cuscuta europaea TaxID=41803 RepID=A0A9P0ZIT8_CUSEU|nr:unnamed protein product [Cuscuta europaea]
MKCIPYTRITMASLLLVSANTDVKVYHPSRLFTKISDCSTPRIRGFSFAPAFNFPVVYPQKSLRRSFSPLNVNSSGDEATGDLIEELRVPIQWSEPSKALEASEWLRVTLNKWLDDEYCPEDTNMEISKVASSSFYKSLMEKEIDIGEILLKMAKDLESISYQESFHGAFSSANAAVSLIIQRIEQES